MFKRQQRHICTRWCDITKFLLYFPSGMSVTQYKNTHNHIRTYTHMQTYIYMYNKIKFDTVFVRFLPLKFAIEVVPFIFFSIIIITTTTTSHAKHSFNMHIFTCFCIHLKTLLIIFNILLSCVRCDVCKQVLYYIHLRAICFLYSRYDITLLQQLNRFNVVTYHIYV